MTDLRSTERQFSTRQMLAKAREAGYRDVTSYANHLLAENEAQREALRAIVAEYDADPGYSASPDYWAGLGTAKGIAEEALRG